MASTQLARRAGARAVDLVLALWVVVLVVVEVVGRLGGGDPWAGRAVPPVTSAQVAVALVGAVIVFDVAPTALWGRTVGKALLGLRVVPSGATGVDRAEADGPVGPVAGVGLVRSVLRSASLFGWLLLPTVGPAAMVVVGASALALPGGRGLADRVAGTQVVEAPVTPGARARRHRYPGPAIDPLPLPVVARTALVEVGVPRAVPGVFAADVRMAVYDDVLFAVGEDPSGLALCVASPSGEVVAIDPDGQRRPLLAGTSLPRFLDALDALAAGGDPVLLRAAVIAADPAAVTDPDSWWPTVLPGI